jgi:hypothetical protein
MYREMKLMVNTEVDGPALKKIGPMSCSRVKLINATAMLLGSGNI